MQWKFLLILLLIQMQYAISFSQNLPANITVVASEKYSSPSFLKRFLLGSNYREEWETPVSVPVLDIKKTGLKIVAMGGGQQTTSLELVDDKNREWALRSIDKNVKPPREFMENTFLERIIQDGVSASYPYVGLSVPTISNAAGVPAGEQELYYVADAPAFGEYRTRMANKLFILVNNQPQVESNITTEEMIEKLDSGSGYYVDQHYYLKARLVDWLMADWDRHEGQSRWIEKKTEKGIAFHIVPRDRDQAFFKSSGWLVKFIGLFFIPHLNKFTRKPKGIKGLSKKSRQFDKRFTNQLTDDDWERITKEFQKNISDSVIETAIKKQPPEIFAIRGEQLIEKLKLRRDCLFEHVMKYYWFLQRTKNNTPVGDKASVSP